MERLPGKRVQPDVFRGRIRFSSGSVLPSGDTFQARMTKFTKEISTMKKLLVFVLAMSITMVGVTAFAQDTMGKTDSTAAAAPLKTLKGDGDKYSFVNDKDQKSWDIMNPEAVKGHEGHHVQLSAHVYADKSAIHVMSVKMMK